ncbi:energy transducer TonB [Pedobacter caeni]|uniref:TonB family C-terminal domain-containing protein n=1 Tax=Pedobacter caeni TaxID=288992 RepID=A0A1M5L4G7_9SPHI|nr:energy transducer TonB [Pedobacter caeni]SHG59982.1 TonB family C-terminal domain-containing protein [Pedobacter caeni]
MNKTGALLISFLCIGLGTFAQRQNQYFLKDNGTYVKLRDSADYIRIVQEPDQGSLLYKVFEYYLDGTDKSSGLSKKIDPPKYEGAYVSYYKNGNKHIQGNYANGQLKDTVDTYYPNGRLYTRMVWPFSEEPNVVRQMYVHTVMDSTGKVLVQNGNGEGVFYNPDFNEVLERGMVKAGVYDGVWTGENQRNGLKFKESYENGKLISGESTDANGQIYAYTKKEILPEFKGGMTDFYNHLKKKIRYPQGAMKKGIQGVVYLRFVVKRDGSLKDIRVMNFVDPELAMEAIRVTKLSPDWTPGVQRGIPVDVFYNVPVSFSLRR